MRVLLTGGRGFVGGHLARLLRAAGHEVLDPSSEAMDLRNALRTSQLVAQLRPERVFHLAALTALVQADHDPAPVRATNVAGTGNLVAALTAHAPDARLVFTSTCHVYGPPQQLPVTEHHVLAPVGVYAQSKADAEAWVLASGLDHVVVRPFHLTGPGQPSTHAASDWARQASQGATVIRCGDLSLRRDFLDVRDACAGLWHAGEHAPSGSVLNLCSGRSVSLGEVLAGVAPGIPPAPQSTRLRQHDVPDLVGDPARLGELGWTASTPLGKTLADLRAWWDRRR